MPRKPWRTTYHRVSIGDVDTLQISHISFNWDRWTTREERKAMKRDVWSLRLAAICRAVIDWMGKNHKSTDSIR